jgi:hypothetical protein
MISSDSVMANGVSKRVQYAAVAASSAGDNTLLAAVTGLKIRVLSIYLVAASDVTARFESGAGGTALSGQMEIPAKGGFVLPFNQAGWFQTAAEALLNLELSSAVSVGGGFSYITVE